LCALAGAALQSATRLSSRSVTAITTTLGGLAGSGTSTGTYTIIRTAQGKPIETIDLILQGLTGALDGADAAFLKVIAVVRADRYALQFDEVFTPRSGDDWVSMSDDWASVESLESLSDYTGEIGGTTLYRGTGADSPRNMQNLIAEAEGLPSNVVSKNPQLGKGYYMSADKEVAKSYANNHKHPMILTYKLPQRLYDISVKDADRVGTSTLKAKKFKDSYDIILQTKDNAQGRQSQLVFKTRKAADHLVQVDVEEFPQELPKWKK